MAQRRPLRNPYYFFMLEKIPELRRRGLEVKGLKEAAPLCSWDWVLLTAMEREKYVQMAQQWKAENEGKVLNEPTAKNQNPLFPAVGKPATHNRDIGIPLMFWPSDKAVCDETFYFISFISMADLPSTCTQRFLPCEIGCVKYSMNRGIIGEFHKFIDPGTIPRGFRYHCQASSDATHKIPLSNFELGSANYNHIFQELFTFLKPVKTNGCIAVYCKLAECFRVDWCLNWLASKAGTINPVKVYELEELIVKLYEHKLMQTPSKTRVERMMDVIVWDYAPNTRCKWHDEQDVVCCALAVAKKCAYCISESLSSTYNFEITPSHVPKKELDYGTKLNPKVLVLDNNYKSKMDRSSVANRYFSSPVQGEASSISLGDGKCTSTNSLREFPIPIPAQFGRGRGALATWLKLPARPQPGIQHLTKDWEILNPSQSALGRYPA
ncbi:protein maelstrom homolog isoform X2 [Callorhinchus milii]|uniref:protein maelstrom homolog isoform X2 n=1 Tax=Callorhinchus milii TaxID=7868 RepID=UPI001C3FAB31|nr:protein maelstrom homolog isoform X2 [Callorhinchus milii]